MLKFPDQPEFLDYFRDVVAFANRMGLLGQLIKTLQDLNQYSYDPQRPERTTRCEIMKDFAPYSFRFVLFRVEHTPEGVKEDFWFNGTITYQGPESPNGGLFPSLTVSLADGIGWFVNT